jgi:CubicO group peptidase (beta-lactamase class C family)
MTLLHILPRSQKALHGLLKLLLVILSANILSSCSKDLIYFPKSVQEEVDKTLDNGYDGIIVCINQDGQSTLYSAGWTITENTRVPADPNSLFKIASISKLYIAAATVKLVIADGKLSLESSLAELIPEVADSLEYSDEITLEMLLQHRSGIPEFIYDEEFANRDPQESYLETANLVFNKGADFKPGKKYSYSNTNYLLIGEILDRTLGFSHHTYIKDVILESSPIKAYILFTQRSRFQRGHEWLLHRL